MLLTSLGDRVSRTGPAIRADRHNYRGRGRRHELANIRDDSTNESRRLAVSRVQWRVVASRRDLTRPNLT
eukprot:gene13468-biopygen9569